MLDQVHPMGVFYDETCATTAEEGLETWKINNYGSELPFSTGSLIAHGECVDCKAVDENANYNQNQKDTTTRKRMKSLNCVNRATKWPPAAKKGWKSSTRTLLDATTSTTSSPASNPPADRSAQSLPLQLSSSPLTPTSCTARSSEAASTLCHYSCGTYHCGIDAWIRCTYLFKMAATMARTNTTPNIIPHGAVLSTFTPNCITIEFRARGPTKVYYADILPAGGTNTCVSFLSFCSIDIQ